MSNAYGPGRGRWVTAGLKPDRASSLGLVITCVLVSTIALVGVLTLRARYGVARSSSPPSPVTIGATEYGFALPDTLPAGSVRLRLVNRGREPHHAVLTRLEAGRTAAEPGALGTVMPGDSAEVVVTLEPGRYLVACYLESPDGVMHRARGMAREFEVAALPRVGSGTSGVRPGRGR